MRCDNMVNSTMGKDIYRAPEEATSGGYEPCVWLHIANHCGRRDNIAIVGASLGRHSHEAMEAPAQDVPLYR